MSKFWKWGLLDIHFTGLLSNLGIFFSSKAKKWHFACARVWTTSLRRLLMHLSRSTGTPSYQVQLRSHKCCLTATTTNNNNIAMKKNEQKIKEKGDRNKTRKTKNLCRRCVTSRNSLILQRKKPILIRIDKLARYLRQIQQFSYKWFMMYALSFQVSSQRSTEFYIQLNNEYNSDLTQWRRQRGHKLLRNAKVDKSYWILKTSAIHGCWFKMTAVNLQEELM